MYVLDSRTSECLHYEHVQGYPRQKVVKIPRDVLNKHANVEIRNDLLDCSIDICSVEVCLSLLFHPWRMNFFFFFG